MASLRGFGEWLKETAQLPWGQLAEKTVEATEATAGLGEAWREYAPKLERLKDLDRIDTFFQRLDSPVVGLGLGALPFASLGLGVLRLYWDVTKTEPTLESSVALAAQIAYLESLGGVLSRADEGTQKKLKRVRLKQVFERQLKKSEDVSLTKARAKRVVSQLRKSELVEAFDEALDELLDAAGLAEWERRVFVEQVAWGAPKYFHGVVAELKDEVEPLDIFLRSDGLRIQEKFDNVEDYLKEKIEPLPEQTIFDEERVTFNDLYVPLMVQPLDVLGKRTKEQPVGIHSWAEKLLEQEEPRQIGFIEGEAGRGKSVFCRMFAAMVRLELYPSFIPILIRLRDVHILENNLTQTLETELQYLDFVKSDSGWLTDKNTRFLLIFDGFDELLLQGRESGGLKELVQQIGDFQKDSHHQCLVTGRPLALQGVDRVLIQTKNLERVRLEPMGNAQREEWLGNWAGLFGESEAEAFRAFLQACPEDIGDKLAQEPLLLYLLGRLHREGHLNTQMFAGAEGIQAKVRVYDESVQWVLERQRQDLNEQISGLKTEDLRQVLQAVALCVVQSGHETAKLTMLKRRFTDSDNPVAELLKQARTETEKSEDKALNNLLTAFYLNPGEGDRAGSVEFAHKSFGEFLFAERLRCAFEAWVEVDRRGRFRMGEGDVAKQIYDLLGYGSLAPEIFAYLKELLFSGFELDNIVRLFQRLHIFYENWSEGFYIDKAPDENLPQGKMMQLCIATVDIGLQQVDIHTGLNVMLLLFGLHRYGQRLNNQQSRSRLSFHPCKKAVTETGNSPIKDDDKLLRLIGYGQLLGSNIFLLTIGHQLNSADLSSTNLSSTNLSSANLSYANLSYANLCLTNFSLTNLSYANLSFAKLNYANLSSTGLRYVNLRSANLCYAVLRSANLVSGNLSSANLSYANLSSANLRYIKLSCANLISANLTFADLSYANLRSADLVSANLISANLTFADFSHADLENIFYDETTNWDDVKGLDTAKNIPELLKQQLGLDSVS